MTRRLLVAAFAVMGAACQETPRLGEYVWVEVEERTLPAFIIETYGQTRFRVHYEGCDERTDEDVSSERIKGRIKERPIESPGACPGTQLAPAPKGSATAAAPDAEYKVGDKVRVMWRGSVYAATIVGVVSDKKFLIHYEGHEKAWDETIDRDRIVTGR